MGNMGNNVADDVLDLDRSSTWQHFEDSLYATESWAQVKLQVKRDGYFDFLNSQLELAPGSITDNLVRCLLNRTHRIVLERYSHVVPYHGCRPVNLTTQHMSMTASYLQIPDP